MDAFKESEESGAGLCAACGHVKKNRSDRGAVFYFCRKSETDRTFRKYPPLPVRDCPGFERVSAPPSA